MEQTKIYVIENYSSFGMLGSSSKAVGFALSKEDAEYAVYKLNKERNYDEHSIFSSYESYSYKEIPFLIKEKGKDFKKFLEEKIKEIQLEIEKSKLCKEKDETNITKLNEELDYYKSR